MHRRQLQQSFNYSAMRVDRARTLKLLLRRENTSKLRPFSDETCRRGLHGMALLWFSQNYAGAEKGRAYSQPEAYPEKHAISWIGRSTARPKYLENPPAAQNISLSSERGKCFQTLASLEHRHHLYSFAGRLCISRCSDGLVQSICTFSSSFEQPRNKFLFGSSRRGSGRIWLSGNFQHRPRSTVHITRVCQCDTEEWNSLQHGRQRKSVRQYFCGAPLEIGEV